MLPSLEVLVELAGLMLMMPMSAYTSLPTRVLPAEVRMLANIVEGLLEGHAETETNLAYLALDHVLQDKEELHRMHQDHHEIDGRLKKVHAASTCAEAQRILKSALVASREHFRLEERSIFPLLEKVLHKETLTELGGTWLQRSVAEASTA